MKDHVLRIIYGFCILCVGLCVARILGFWLCHGGGLRERTSCAENYFRRLQTLKQKLYKEFVWLEGSDLCHLMSRLAHYQYNRRKMMLVGIDYCLIF